MTTWQHMNFPCFLEQPADAGRSGLRGHHLLPSEVLPRSEQPFNPLCLKPSSTTSQDSSWMMDLSTVPSIFINYFFHKFGLEVSFLADLFSFSFL